MKQIFYMSFNKDMVTEALHIAWKGFLSLFIAMLIIFLLIIILNTILKAKYTFLLYQMDNIFF